MKTWMVLLLVGCGHGAPLKALSVPPGHVSAEAACASPSPAGDCVPNTSGTSQDSCKSDSDCTKGRCLTGQLGCYCEAADCTSDSDCATNQICACSATVGSTPAVTNRCLPTGCHIDADCGAGQYCAPSLDAQCGARLGVTSYACTTPQDECHIDADCPIQDGMATPFCAFSAELGHWSCEYTVCTG